MYLRICGSPQKIIGSANRKSTTRKKYMVRKSQIQKLPHSRKVRKSKKIEARKFADLQFAELICRPPTFSARRREIIVRGQSYFSRLPKY